MNPESESRTPAQLGIEQEKNSAVLLRLTGSWRLRDPLPTADSVEQAIISAGGGTIVFDATQLTAWDTGLLTFLTHVQSLAGQHEMDFDRAGLPDGVRRLLELAEAVPIATDTGRSKQPDSFFSQIGNVALDLYRSGPDMVRFVGEVAQSVGRLFQRKAQFRLSDLWLLIQQAGPEALPIVSLISFLVGLIFAYMGAVQLQQFGAQIYIADLVGIGMVREIGALMTGIIMAGRTGASYAAQLGTMQVNEEIDAFRVLGISPVDFLVLPRMLALSLMVPLLTLYAGVVGILAGLCVAVFVFDLGVFEYYHQTVRALELKHFAIGVIKGSSYGILIAIAGCYRGIRCGGSAAAVGQATTSAVVTSIVFIVVSASILTIVFQVLGI